MEKEGGGGEGRERKREGREKNGEEGGEILSHTGMMHSKIMHSYTLISEG